MAFFVLLMLIATTADAWPKTFFGGSLIVCPKLTSSNGTTVVDLRTKEGTYHCYENTYSCKSGDCGTVLQKTTARIAWDSYGIPWCQTEITTKIRLPSNLPFEIQYPVHRHYRYGYGYWVSNNRGYRVPLRMMAHVDLGTRADSGAANRPPVSTMLPILRLSRNCLRPINLSVFDPDGDRVRCRVPTDSNSYECSFCSLPNGVTLDGDSCSLSFSGVQNGHYTIELVVEDFPQRNIRVSYSDGSYTVKHPLSVVRRRRQIIPTTQLSTTTPEFTTASSTSSPGQTRSFPPTSTVAATTRTVRFTQAATNRSATTTNAITNAATRALPDPMTTTTNLITSHAAPATTTVPGRYRSSIPSLSKLPMQFSVSVDSYSPPSCVDGDYFPLFLAPTPVHGAQIPAFIHKTLEIKVKATVQYSSFYKLLLTGPKGISQRTVSTGSYIISWTPTENELNGHFPVCFVSEVLYSYHPYQSELRCVMLNVGHHEAVVTCSETAIKVEVEKTFLIRRNEANLHLNRPDNPSCNLQRLSNYTHVVAVMSLNSCGTRIEEDEDNIIFQNSITSADPEAIISRQHDVDIDISCIYPKRTNVTLGFTHKNPYAFQERGFGAFTFQFEFFQSQLFRQQVDASTYPVEVYLKQMIYMQVESSSSIPNTELFVESCRATPYDNPDSRVSYTIIENGCVKDTTVQIFPSSRSQFRFGMQTFEFIGAHDEVYITCLVLLCESGVPGTRCSQGCIPGGNNRAKREAPAQTSSHFISQGPLHLVKTSDGEGERAASGLSLNLGVNLLFIVGCLLACAVVIYRSRSSRAKYQRLPTSDTD